MEAWLSRKYGPRSKEAMYWLQFGDRSLDVKLKTGNGLLVSLIVTRETTTIEEAIRIIIGGCNLWQLGSYLDEKPSGCPSTVSRRGISSVVAPERLVIDNKNYSKSNEIYIRNYSGVIDSGVISYHFMIAIFCRRSLHIKHLAMIFQLISCLLDCLMKGIVCSIQMR